MFLKQYTTKKDQLTGRIICYGPQNHHEEPQRETKENRQVRNWMIIVVCAAVILAVVALIVIRARAEDQPDAWILCMPEGRVNIRRTPEKDGIIDGFLECGDGFRTDGVCRNGFVHALGLTENGEGWIYCGFVVTDRPEKVYENYVCVARKCVACRRWCDGPQVSGRARWLKNGSNVTVFYRAKEWSVTSRGYIQSEWLEVDPEL